MIDCPDCGMKAEREGLWACGSSAGNGVKHRPPACRRIAELRDAAATAAAKLSPTDACGLDLAVDRALSLSAERGATIDKLPKTSDGAPIILGENMWALDGVDSELIVCVGAICIKYDDESESDPIITLRDGLGEEWDVRPMDCYSTEEAALAAAEAGGA